jgi:GNAT superfamily N-acetyltransferase
MPIRKLESEELEGAAGELAALLIDAVEDGAGVSFMSPLGVEQARGYWLGLAPGVSEGRTMLFVAEDDGRIDGTVQLIRAWQPNQPHRGDLSKLLVHRRARRKGLGARLVEALEEEARRLGLTLITFDTVTGGPAERFYQKLGFTRVGEIPGYAYLPDGVMGSTTIFYRQL